jgi:serine/threonine protein kinase
VHDSGLLPDGRFYYVMKLVRGRRLDEQAEQPTPLAERLRLFQKICDAVVFAHAHGVIHRDLKPQNIMLGPFGEVLVMDWGVAREIAEPQLPAGSPTANGVQAQPAQTAHGTVLGTPGYMAPEQARGEMNLIDERTDVYAMGASLYFLLTGQAPLPEGQLAASGTSGVWLPCPPRRRDRSIPRPLEAICLKALAVERSERYASVHDLAEDIANFLAGLRVQAYPESFVGAVWRLATKYRAVLALILAYLIMRILLLIFARS